MHLSTLLLLLTSLPTTLSISPLLPGGTFNYTTLLAQHVPIFTPMHTDIHPPSTLYRLPPAPGGAGIAGTLCETSSGSPNYDDTLKVVLFLFELGNLYCCQLQLGNTCTTMARYGTAEVKICGEWGKCIRCGFAALGADEIIRGCWSNAGGVKKAGGRFFWDREVVNMVSHT